MLAYIMCVMCRAGAGVVGNQRPGVAEDDSECLQELCQGRVPFIA